MATKHELQWLLEGVEEEKQRARREGFLAGVFFTNLLHYDRDPDEGELFEGDTAGTAYGVTD